MDSFQCQDNNSAEHESDEAIAMSQTDHQYKSIYDPVISSSSTKIPDKPFPEINYTWNDLKPGKPSPLKVVHHELKYVNVTNSEKFHNSDSKTRVQMLVDHFKEMDRLQVEYHLARRAQAANKSSNECQIMVIQAAKKDEIIDYEVVNEEPQQQQQQPVYVSRAGRVTKRPLYTEKEPFNRVMRADGGHLNDEEGVGKRCSPLLPKRTTKKRSIGPPSITIKKTKYEGNNNVSNVEEMTQCPICSVLYSPKEIQEHASNCGVYTFPDTQTKRIACEICDAVVPFSTDYEVHVQQCIAKQKLQK